MNEFNKNSEKQQQYVEHVKKSLIRQSNLNSSIFNTDSMIYNTLKDQEQNSREQKKLLESKTEQNLKRKHQEKRRKIMEQELEDYRKLR